MSDSPDNHATLAPVLVLIHGATLNGHMWGPVRHRLDPSYRILAPDLPGHGSRRSERFTLDAAVATIVAAAKSVSPAPVVLVGDSLGAYTAMASANALPQSQLRGLVLGGSTFNFFGPHVFPYVAKGAFLRALAALLGEQRLINRQMPKELGPSRLDLDPVDARALMEGGLSVTVFAQAVKALRRIDFRAKLAAIEQPVLIVNGDRDKVHIEQEASFLSVAQHATSQRFANCEHGVSLWRHAEFAELVNAFAARVFARDAAALAVLSGTSV